MSHPLTALTDSRTEKHTQIIIELRRLRHLSFMAGLLISHVFRRGRRQASVKRGSIRNLNIDARKPEGTSVVSCLISFVFVIFSEV